MRSIGWAWTRAIHKRKYCDRCGTRQHLHLHHRAYRGYHLLGVFAFILPDLISQFETLCARHHAEAHRKTG
jgi:hypothetical protein